MTFFSRVDPQLQPGIEFLSGRTPPTTVPELVAMRAVQAAGHTELPAALRERLTIREHLATGTGPDVPVRSYRPRDAVGPLPCLVWVHGGGMIAGSVAGDDAHCAQLALSTGAMVISVEYRLAPEHPFPAGLDDVYQSLQWAYAQACPLGVDPFALAIGGASAGGGLAAAAALRARDRQDPPLRFQYLLYPMLDDRDATASSIEFSGIPSWNRERNALAWAWYLDGDAGADGGAGGRPGGAGGRPGGADVSPEAAPARATDLSGLPPALLQVGELDLFRDEDLEYATRLLQAGVATEVQVYAGAFHGFEGLVPDAAVSVRLLRDRDEALRRALFDDHAPLTVPAEAEAAESESTALTETTVGAAAAAAATLELSGHP